MCYIVAVLGVLVWIIVSTRLAYLSAPLSGAAGLIIAVVGLHVGSVSVFWFGNGLLVFSGALFALSGG